MSGAGRHFGVDQAEKPSEDEDPPPPPTNGKNETEKQQRRRRHISSENSLADPQNEEDEEVTAQRRGTSGSKHEMPLRKRDSTNGSHSPQIPQLADNAPNEGSDGEGPSERKGPPHKSKLPKKILKTKREKGPSSAGFEGEGAADSSSDIQDFENVKFINQKDLPKLPKTEADRKGHFLGTSHKFDKPIGAFQIRVRLLKYPSLTEKVKWPGDLAVVDDRVFTWQEKVFSIWEAEKYAEKRNLKTDLDHEYHKMIDENPQSVGAFLHSYVNDDFFVMQQRKKTLQKKCAAVHLKSREECEESQYLMGGDGDAVDFSLIDVDSSAPSNKTSQQLSEADRDKLSQIQKSEEERRHKEALKQEALKEKALQRQQEEDQKRLQNSQKKNLETQKRLRKLEEMAATEELTKKEGLTQFSKARRPTSSVSAELFSTSKSIKKGKHREDDDEGEYEELRGEGGAKGGLKLPLVGDKRPAWQVSVPGRNKFIDKPALENPPKCMYIMASLPDMKRKKREMIVCLVKVYGSSGMVVMKPPFGYRIIEARRNHAYRLSWELHSPSSQLVGDYQGEMRGKMSILPPLIPSLHQQHPVPFAKGSRSTFDFGGSFEQVSVNEMRVFGMGEIVSAKGFQGEPLCVHYLVEVPQGWKSDGRQNDLEGTTHSSYTTDDTTAHFSHSFSFQLLFSMDAVAQMDSYQRPVILIMVASLKDSGRVGYEGYGYTPLPTTPGPHLIQIKTWKPKPRSIEEEMQGVFLDATPSLHDLKAVHIPSLDPHGEHQKVGNRLGLQTDPSGIVILRLNVIHQTPSTFKDQSSKLDLLEKMSSATILKSVQAVIDAFNRAKNRAIIAKGNSTRKEPTHL